MNDIVVLPIVLVLIAITRGTIGGAGGWLAFWRGCCCSARPSASWSAAAGRT